MFDMNEIGRRISSLRKKKGMTQMALANEFGISFQAVSNWERGTAMPDISNLSMLASLLDTTVDYILGDEKTASILNDLNENKTPDEAITAEEFNSIAPILPPDKNKILLSTISTPFANDTSSETALANLDFDDEAEEAEAMARKAFDDGNVPIFTLLKNRISKECAEELLFEAAVNPRAVPFVALLSKNVSDEKREQCALYAFASNNIPVFAVLKNALSYEKIKELRRKAADEGNMPFFAILNSSKKYDEDDEDFDDDDFDDDED